MNFQDAIKTCLQKYADFKGTAQRPEFWWFVLFTFIASGILNQIHPIAGSIFSLATFLPSIAVATRRLHDLGKSGWWQLIALTVIGIFVLVYWYSQEGKAQEA